MCPTKRQPEVDEAALAKRLEPIEDALDADQLDDALALCRAELERAPKEARLNALLGECLDRGGDHAGAIQAFKTALKAAPEDTYVLRSAVEFLLGDPEEDPEAYLKAVTLAERGAKKAAATGDREAQLDFMLAQGIALNGMGNSTAALGPLEQAIALEPDVDLLFEYGYANFQLCRFASARKALESLLVQDPEHAAAYHYLGLLAERDGDDRLAERHFEKARQIAPDDFLPPVILTPDAFERAIEEALEGLPKRLQHYLENVTISVEEIPAEADLLRGDPPTSPEILGLFQGTPMTQSSVLQPADPWSSFPSSISLYQRNLQRFAATRDELIEEIGITLIHEIGHFLGLSEEDLYERGLD